MTARLLALGLAFAVLSAAGQEAVDPAVADAQRYLTAGSIQMDGPLGEQLDACLRNRLLAQDVQALVQPFSDRRDVHEWRSEFWGKWFTSGVEAWRDTLDPALHDRLDQAAALLITTQSPDGYLGAYPDAGHRQSWDLWGRKYTLLGLLAWHAETGDPRLLEAACRLADHLLTEVGPGRGRPFQNDMWNGLASSSILEPMVLLYRRTGRAEYLDWARWLVGEWSTPDGPDLLRKALDDVPVYDMFAHPAADPRGYGDGGKSKAYEMMSCIEGLIELYRSTAEPSYREAALRVYDNIRRSEITIIGSGSDWERWCDGTRRQTEPWRMGIETCVTVTWIKLAAQLLRLTGDPRYADDIELAAHNALLGAHAIDGTWWCHHTPLAGIKERAPEQCGMHANCCVANGPRGLMLLPQLALTAAGDGLAVNFYGQWTGRAKLPDGSTVALEVGGDYRTGGEVSIRVRCSRPSNFTLHLRIPAWSRETRLSVNGRPQAAEAGRYIELSRTWSTGDWVALQLDVTPRLVIAPGAPNYVAVARGPLVLARDVRLGDGDIDAPVNLTGHLRMVEGQTPPHIALVCEATDGDGPPVRLCDFASAGNTWDESSRYRVWMPRAAR